MNDKEKAFWVKEPDPMDFCGELCLFAENIIKEAKKPKWIPVSERLPDEDTLVLCVGAKGGMFLGYVCWLRDDKTVAYTSVPNSRGGRYAKYWMPLPEPPEEE